MSAVNESVWEHLKLLFIPALLFTIVEYFVRGKSTPGFVCRRTIGILSGMALIVALFYAYTGILRRDFFIVDILIFLIAAAVTFYLPVLLERRKKEPSQHCELCCWFILVLTFTLFVAFTFNAPQLELFRDPVSGGYGLPI